MDITTVNPKTGKPQSWEIKIRDFNYLRLAEFIDAYSSNWNEIPNLYKLTDAIAKIEATTFNGLEFVPLTEEGTAQTNEDRNCYSYRGESKPAKRGEPYTPDANAFVIRKQAIDFIASARGGYYYQADHTCVKVIGFQSWLSNRSMTPGQRDTLKEWFGQQIIDAVTPEVLKAVKDEYKAKLIAHVKEDIPKIMGWWGRSQIPLDNTMVSCYSIVIKDTKRRLTDESNYIHKRAEEPSTERNQSTRDRPQAENDLP